MAVNSKAGLEAVGFLILGSGLLVAYSAFKNKSIKGVLVNSVNPSAGASTTLGPSSYGTDGVTGPQSSGETLGPVIGASGKAQQVVAYAMSQVGQPYLWGGTGVGGFDCSGLTMEAYKAAGVSLPRIAQAQYAATQQYATANPQSGDLVFFGTASNIHHVGIALGNGQMVDAPNAGAKVRVEQYTSGWDFFGATSPLQGGG